MQIIDIKSLEGQLQACVRAAQQGEIVRIADDGHIVAEIVPARDGLVSREHTAEPVAPGTQPQPTLQPALPPEQRWADLIRRGIVTLAEKPLTGPPPRFPIMSLDELMTELAED